MNKNSTEPYARKNQLFRPTVGIALFIAFAFISVPPILFFGTWLSRQQTENAQIRFDQEAKIRAQAIEEGVLEFIKLKKEVLNVTAGTLSTIEAWHPEELQSLTDAQIKSSASFDSFYVGSPQGISIVYAPSIRKDGSRTQAGVSYQDRDYFQKLIKTKKATIGSMKLGKQSRVANIHVTVPIYQDLDLREEGNLRGYITGGIKTSLIEQVISRILKGKDNFRAVLMEFNHRVIADSQNEIPIFTLLPSSSVFGSSCETDLAIDTLDLHQKAIRASCRKIRHGSLNWTLWISTPQSYIAELANQSISFTIKIAFLLLVGVIFVAATMSLWVGRLMGLITMNAQRVSSGLFDITLPPVYWFTPREVVEVGNISLQTLARVKESDQKVRELVVRLEEVNRQQAPLADAWKQVSEAIEILDPKGIVLFVNPAFHDLFNRTDIEHDTEENILNHKSVLFDLQDPMIDHRSIGEVILSHAQVGLPWSSEVEVKQGRKRLVQSIHTSPIFDQENNLVRVIVTRRDVTEKRIAQASAAHNDRLASIGTLAAGMAHEINNPMTYIKMSLELIQESLEEAEQSNHHTQDGYLIDRDTFDELADATQDASEGVKRVSNIVQSLLSIARGGGQKGESERMSQVKLNEVIQACANLVKPEFSKSVELSVEVIGDLKVWGRRSELIQVLLNFLINASQAMPPDRDQGNWVKVKAWQTEKGEVKLMVSDNAKGIPEEDLTHIFEPFFSSKPVGQGTGLGLAVSRGIIEDHHAHIEVSSKEGKGTSFILTFPALNVFPELTSTMVGMPELLDGEKTPLKNQPIQLSGPDESIVESKQNKRNKILIVDDDLLVAKSLARMLKEEVVMVASSGFQALKVLRSYQFDLILSDVMMPEMDGPTLYQEIQIKFPHYTEKFIFITGAAKGSKTIEALEKTNRLILSKPITKRRLLSIVDQYTS